MAGDLAYKIFMYLPKKFPQSYNLLLGLELFAIVLYVPLVIIFSVWFSSKHGSPVIVPVSPLYQIYHTDRDIPITVAIVPEGHDMYLGRSLNAPYFAASPDNLTGLMDLIPTGSADFCDVRDRGYSEIMLTRHLMVLNREKTGIVGFSVGTDPDDPRSIDSGALVISFLCFAVLFVIIQLVAAFYLRKKGNLVTHTKQWGILFGSMSGERVCFSVPVILIILRVLNVTDIYTYVLWSAWLFGLQFYRFYFIMSTERSLINKNFAAPGFVYRMKLLLVNTNLFAMLFPLSNIVFSVSVILKAFNWNMKLLDATEFLPLFYEGLSIYTILLVIIFAVLNLYADLTCVFIYRNRTAAEVTKIIQQRKVKGDEKKEENTTPENPEVGESMAVSGIFVVKLFYLLADASVFLFFILYFAQSRFGTC